MVMATLTWLAGAACETRFAENSCGAPCMCTYNVTRGLLPTDITSSSFVFAMASSSTGGGAGLATGGAIAGGALPGGVPGGGRRLPGFPGGRSFAVAAGLSEESVSETFVNGCGAAVTMNDEPHSVVLGASRFARGPRQASLGMYSMYPKYPLYLDYVIRAISRRSLQNLFSAVW